MLPIEPGHIYTLNRYDEDNPGKSTLTFMKRVGPGYPGNNIPAHGGTNCQEVLRALIDRVKYLDNQCPCEENDTIIQHLRSALYEFEFRAARRDGRVENFIKQTRNHASCLESILSCVVCGHLFCEKHATESP